MQAVNVEAMRGLAEAAVAAGVKRIVHVSSVGVISAVGSGVVTEETPCRPRNAYERSKLAGEQVVLACAQGGRIEAVIVRPTIVFGEGTARPGDSFLEWLRAVQQGRFVFIGTKAVANYVYVGDVVEAMLRLPELPVSEPVTYIVADSASMQDFVGAMAQALGVPHAHGVHAGLGGLRHGCRHDGRQPAHRNACSFDPVEGPRADLGMHIQWGQTPKAGPHRPAVRLPKGA